jgi:hypothetical protein
MMMCSGMVQGSMLFFATPDRRAFLVPGRI